MNLQVENQEQQIPDVKGKVIALDTETTGFKADDEVLQLSIVDEKGKEIFNQYFKPDHKKSWEQAMSVNHITPEMLADKKTISAYKDAIEQILKDAKEVVGYNTGFDMTMLTQNGITLPEEKKYVDLMEPFAKVYGEKKADGSLKMKKLIDCATYYGFSQNGEWHNSQGDTAATMYCYKKMKEKSHITEKDVKSLGHLLGDYQAMQKRFQKNTPKQNIQAQVPEKSPKVVVKRSKRGASHER